MRRGRAKSSPQIETVDVIHQIALRHGQTLWLMTELGLRRGVSMSTFNYYVKSLRKLGIPFEQGKGQLGGHRHVTYEFEELMELAVALRLRVYGILPDLVAKGLRSFREELKPIYQQAYLDTLKQIYPSAHLRGAGKQQIVVNGVFLDLNIHYASGPVLEFGPPKILSPFEALSTFVRSEIPAQSYLPLNLTEMAKAIMERVTCLPPVRRKRGSPHA